MSSNFEILPRDPRPISNDLKRVLIEQSDPHYMFIRWKNFLERWGISPTDTKYKWLVTSTTLTNHYIYNREDAISALQKEDDLSKAIQKQFRFKYIEHLESLVNAAFGFWLFPLEAFGPLPEQGQSRTEHTRDRGDHVWDLSAYQPELALSNIP